jgi:hypothetical protein
VQAGEGEGGAYTGLERLCGGKLVDCVGWRGAGLESGGVGEMDGEEKEEGMGGN